jgi:phenylacetate-coenzyme A ligase PaaK-like adenylate-forming protein
MFETAAFVAGVVYYHQFMDKFHRWFPQIQLRRFRRLLAHAQRHSPYLKQKYRGIDARTARPTDVPAITKAEMMAHFDDIVTNRRIRRRDVEAFVADKSNVGTFFLGKYPVLHTSGSQGQPALLVQDPGAFRRLFSMQVARGHTLPKTWTTFFSNFLNKKRWAIFQLRPGFFPSGAAFAYMPPALRRFVEVLRLNYTDPFAENVRRLNEFQPHFISGYGHIMVNLARAEMAGELRLRAGGQLQLMTSIAEPVFDETVQTIRDVFGIHLASHYAMGECLTLSMGCPFHPGAHLNTDLAMLEVADRNGQPVPNGQPGDKVRITNLCNYVQPIIRYEIDDVVTMSDRPCPCGHPLPLIRKVAGRYNDHLWIDRDGRRQQLPTFFFTTTFHALLDLAEFQVMQTQPNRFVVQAISLPGRGLTAERILQALRQQAQSEGLADLLHFEVQLVEHIPPDPRTGKLRRYVSKLDDQETDRVDEPHVLNGRGHRRKKEPAPATGSQR